MLGRTYAADWGILSKRHPIMLWPRLPGPRLRQSKVIRPTRRKRRLSHRILHTKERAFQFLSSYILKGHLWAWHLLTYAIKGALYNWSLNRMILNYIAQATPMTELGIAIDSKIWGNVQKSNNAQLAFAYHSRMSLPTVSHFVPYVRLSSISRLSKSRYIILESFGLMEKFINFSTRAFFHKVFWIPAQH